MIRNLKEINAYVEFRTADGINQVRTAVQTNTLPAGLTQLQSDKFNDRFLSGDFIVENVPPTLQGNQEYGNPRLKYRIDQQNKFLVSYPDERLFYIDRIWRNRKRGLGLGLQAFYLQVAQSHLNIQKKYTDAFLKSKGNYQIQKVPVKKVNKPIISKTSNERWSMDLIDMSLGNTHRYILSVVDNFSGFLWTRRINNRNRFTILNNLQNIIDTSYPRGSSETYPRLIQADKGGEFHNNDLRNFCENNNITLIFSKSYSPSSNGKIERKNREIRKKIKAGFIRQNRNYWNANMLNDYTQNINRQVDGRSKFRPIDLYTVGYNPPEEELQPVVPLDNHNTPEEIQNINRNYHRTRAIRLTNGRRNRFQVGDLVRVNMMELSADYRRIRKEDLSNTNKLAIHYSPVVSRVTGVFPPNDNTRFVESYSIAVGEENGLPPPANEGTWNEGGAPILFTGSQLVSAGNQVSVAPRTIERVDRMNSRN